MTDLFQVVAALLLVVLCGLFVAAEFAFVTVDRAAVESQAAAGDARSRGLAAALRSLSTQLSGAQLGITVTNLAIGFLAEPAIAGIGGDVLVRMGLPASNVDEVSLVLGLALATVLTMVFGELVPKNLALARPLAVARAVQGFQRRFTTVMRHPIRALNGSANAIVRAMGIEPQEELRSSRSPAEVESLVRRSAQEGTLDTGTAELVQRALRFRGRLTSEIMTPRVQVHAVGAEEPVTQIVHAATRTGRSRFPVVEGGLDAVVGVVHLKHAIAVPPADRPGTSVGDLAVPLTHVPASLSIEQLLPLVQAERLQLALVVDEYGGTAGLVTLEDIVEELVGEIDDEHDPGRLVARRTSDDEWVVSGLLRIDEVGATIGAVLPESTSYDTLAGLLVAELGHLPEDGESVDVPVVLVEDDGTGLAAEAPATARLRVLRMEGRRVDRIGLQVTDRRGVTS